jgi:hypothetical protein
MADERQNGVLPPPRNDGEGQGCEPEGLLLGDAGASGNGVRGNPKARRNRVAATQRANDRTDGSSGLSVERRGLAEAAIAAISSAPLVDEQGSKLYPVLVDTINRTKDVNGDDCEPGGFSVNAKAGRLSWSLRSPAFNIRISGWAESLVNVLEAIEAALSSGNVVPVELKKHVSRKYRDKNKRA